MRQETELIREPDAAAPRHEPEAWDPSVVEENPRFARVPVEHTDEAAPASFQVEDYLAGERAKDLLRFSTAGSVDDGKSTLIGRLLYDTQSVYEDQVKSIEGKGTTQPGVLDLALLTDGLRAEREQGITIDVAYRYFSTARRRFIIADTPGHEQYTRNMATGASTADAAIVLIDARKGLLPQSRRHARIATLLGVPHLLVAVNKMDLVEWSEPVFTGIRDAFALFVAELAAQEDLPVPVLQFVPVSALTGDNVVHGSAAMPWYTGPTLLALLEAVPPSSQPDTEAPFRMAVQRVVRPDLDFRGFAGQIASGSIRPGDRLRVLPSGRESTVERIVTFDGDLAEATAPLSVTVTLADEVDISRGDLLVAPERPAASGSSFTASVVWMDSQPLDPDTRYLLKQTSRTVSARASILSGSEEMLAMNDIGLLAIETLQPLHADAYAANRHTGSFILIDRATNATVAAGMIRGFADASENKNGPVRDDERASRWGHPGAHLRLSGSHPLLDAIERALWNQGATVLRVPAEHAEAVADAGALALSFRAGAPALQVGAHRWKLPPDAAEATQSALRLLYECGILEAKEGA